MTRARVGPPTAASSEDVTGGTIDVIVHANPVPTQRVAGVFLLTQGGEFIRLCRSNPFNYKWLIKSRGGVSEGPAFRLFNMKAAR